MYNPGFDVEIVDMPPPLPFMGPPFEVVDSYYGPPVEVVDIYPTLAPPVELILTPPNIMMDMGPRETVIVTEPEYVDVQYNGDDDCCCVIS